MHNFAIVDEVDNILIDEARTPLIISGAPEQAADLYEQLRQARARTSSPGKKPEGMDPRAKKEFTADYDYEFDEKHKTVSITEQGVEKAERFLGIEHLYRAENGVLVNHLNQSLKAESLYKKDVDYAVIDGEVKIIDEFTGRILDGRRWSEGLHQAVEAKEGVRVREENQTLATVTLQNYFRMYDKLAGMSGTALTEATEFMKIYKVGVVEIPTNQPMVRMDKNDQIYKTREGKWRAVAREIQERHDKGQPVLVGTISVEVSELLSERLRKMGVPHTVLNAKPEHAEREGSIIAEAGAPGAVTIATNMAGRGVDIKLGGNPEHLTEIELTKLGLRPGDPDYEERFADILPKIEERVEANREVVYDAGGLFIVGTERHESRRIDNQLRGRAGRQGDPGESRFFLSAEDDLVRLFAGDRIYKILDRLGPKGDDGEEEPIEAKMLTKQIEGAQRKVEEQNYLIRKRVLEYDDVMNQQREVVYKYRDEVLEGRDMADVAREQIEEVIGRLVDEYTPGDFVDDWDLEELWVQLDQMYHVDFGIDELDRSAIDREELKRMLAEDALALYDEREAGARRGAHARARALPDPADHRSALARAPLRHGLPARGHPPARVRADRAAGGLQERGLHALRGPDELDLGRLRAHDLQRRGRGPGARRGSSRPPQEWTPAPQQPQSNFGALEYSGGTLEDQPTAYGDPEDGSPRGAAGRGAAPRRRERERSAATTRAGAARARSSRSATELEVTPARLRARHRVGPVRALKRVAHQVLCVELCDWEHAAQSARRDAINSNNGSRSPIS